MGAMDNLVYFSIIYIQFLSNTEIGRTDILYKRVM